MSNTRIFCFGDSFTVGEGANLAAQRELEKQFSLTTEGSRKAAYLANKLNRELSWTQHLANIFNVEVFNLGETGASNIKIFNNIFEQEVKYGGFTSNDLVVIMWSSSIRNKLNWFPNIFSQQGPVGAGWSLKELFSESAQAGFTQRYYDIGIPISLEEKQYLETTLSPFISEYFKTYITELYNEEYYNIVNLNLIKFIQEYFKSRSIPYIMVDAFECMNSFKAKKDTKWEKLIDTRYYFGEGNTTVWDELDKIGGDVWEDPELSFHPPGQRCHPNAEGYKLIGDMLIDFISRKIWTPKLF